MKKENWKLLNYQWLVFNYEKAKIMLMNQIILSE